MTRVALRHHRARLAVAAGLAGMMTAALAASGSVSAASPTLSSSTTGLTFIDDSLTWPSLDPASSVSEGTENPVYSLIYGNLFTVGPNGKAVPGLATGYSFSSNGLTFTLDLRSGVKFQDGTPFDSTAVKDSLERDISPKLDCSCIPALSAIKTMTTPTPTKLVVQLSHPDGVLVPALETSGASFVTDHAALAREGEKKYSLSPVGAGPFRLVRNIENSSMTLDGWSGYWDAKAVHLKTIKVLSQSSATTELATMQGGSAQLLAFTEDSTEEKEALADPRLTTITSDDTITTNFVYINPGGSSPLGNRLAREALFYATDSSGISKAVFDGFATPTQQLIGTSMQDFLGNKLPGFLTYDPKKAKALVKQLGGLKVTLTPLVDNTPGLEQAEALEKQWDAAGIKTTINQEGFPTVLAQMEKGDYETIIAGYPPQTNGALALVGTLVCKSFFDPYFCDQTMTKDEKQALTEANLAKQGQLVRKAMIRAIVKDLMYLPLNQDPGVVVAAKNLRGFHVYGGNLYFGEAYFG